jgi:cytochrome c peroxidase
MRNRLAASSLGMIIILLAAAVIAVQAGLFSGAERSYFDPSAWTEAEVAALRSLRIGSLKSLPPDPSNAVADDPRTAKLGQRIFFDTRFSANGAVSCATCHQPHRMFTDGLPLDEGRAVGVQKVQADPFNCLGAHSDAGSEGSELIAAFKTPTLRNMAETAPYMHAGQFSTWGQVLDHYNRAVSGTIGHNELAALNLSEIELAQLEAFLQSLSGPLTASSELLEAP